MLLFVGLGNPGPKYSQNRHNVGFMALDEIARCHGLPAARNRFQSTLSEGRIAGQRVLLQKPETFMNESGQAVGAALRFFKLPVSAVTVFYDDLDLKPGKVKVKTGGGAGGHNGLRSLDAHIGNGYQRVRIGIGHPGDKYAVMNYVLQDFAKAERDGWLADLLPALADEAATLIAGDSGRVMSRLAHAVFPPPPKAATPPAEETAADAAEPAAVAPAAPTTLAAAFGTAARLASGKQEDQNGF